jgi:dipeptidyl aminopeptidase/acylaminoacyl peptidase
MSNGFPQFTNHKSRRSLRLLLTLPCNHISGHSAPIPNRQSRITYLASILILFSSLAWVVAPCCAQQAKKSFTVAEEIELAHFGDPYTAQAEAVRFSPNGNYVAVDTERGRLELNRVEDALRFYRTQDIENFLEHSDETEPPSPLWSVTRSTDKDGPIIRDWRWLADSSGVAFLEHQADGNQRLILADVRNKAIESLTSETETVSAFDVRDGNHYVYTAADTVSQEKRQAEHPGSATVGTGYSLFQLLFPNDPVVVSLLPPQSHLWAVLDGRRFEVKHDGMPLVTGTKFVLSPDGRSLVTTLAVPEVPSSWETLYPPPYASYPYRARPGDVVHQYIRVDLPTGTVQALTEAPISNDMGWYAEGSPSWSSDGQEILLPGTFIKSNDRAPSRPCVAVVDISSNACTCVERLKARTETGFEEGYHLIDGVRFAGGDKQRIMVSFHTHGNFFSLETTEYQPAADGSWRVTQQTKGVPEIGTTQISGLSEVQFDGLEVAAKEGLNDPPRLIATKKQISRVIWDPNPQLKNIELGDATVYKWKDKGGQERKGGLFKPSNYKLGQRYPLVIQTHGFNESLFLPSGTFTTAFAARALAAQGIVVLQVGAVGNCPDAALDEGPCNTSGYETVVNHLVSDGLVDPDEIGIIGFSRSCFHVMEALTSGSLHFKAASITDGVMGTYFQYMVTEGFSNDLHARFFDSVIGAKPFGEGLQQWLKRSPGFNLDKVTTPLLVVGEGPASLLFMWEPYAGLRYLRKPVDLIMLNTDEHVLTNPSVRMASQGGSVDWFRFWLQDYECPDPAKVEQYKRWRELRKLQEANRQKPTSTQAAGNRPKIDKHPEHP